MALGDQTTGQYVVTEIPVNPFYGLWYFSVEWSDDVSTFLATAFNGWVYETYYVQGFEQSLADVTVEEITDFDWVTAHWDNTFPFERVFDISSDEDRLLLEGIPENLILLNLADKSQNQVIGTEGWQIDAAFSQSDEQTIVFMDENGISSHNLATGQTELLVPTINHTGNSFEGYGYFSPDARKMAFIDSSAFGKWSLYIIDVPDSVQQTSR